MAVNRQLAKYYGYSDDQINAYEMSKGRSAMQQPAAPTDRGFRLTDLLPIAGSIVGGVAGTPFGGPVGSIGGAAAGGAGGEWLRQKLEGEDDLGKVATEGGLGLLGGVGGKVLGKAASLVGKRVLGASEGVSSALKQGTRQIKQPASIYGAKSEKAINATLDKYPQYFKGSAQQQYEGLEPAMQEIEGKIQELIVKNPTLATSKEQIKQSFVSNLKSSLRSKDLTQKQATTEIEGYLNDLIRASGGTGKFTNISLARLRDLKKLVNEDYGPVHALIQRGGALSPRQKVIAAAWDSLDDAVKEVSPEVKELLVDESNLYKAASSLSGARANPPTLRFMGTSVPASVTQKARDLIGGGAGATSRVLSSPVTQGAGRIGSQVVGQVGSRAANLVTGGGEASAEFEDTTPIQGELVSTPTRGQLTPEAAILLMAKYPKQAALIKSILDIQGGGKKTEAQVARDESTFLVDTAIQQLSNRNLKLGPGASQLEELKSIFNAGDPATLEFNRTIAALQASIAKARAGTSFTPNEQKLLDQYTPKIGDSRQQVQTKLVGLKRIFSRSSGVQILPNYPSPVDSYSQL